MEKVEQKTNFNESIRYLQKYDISDITELEEGMLFGTITSRFNIFAIYPTFDYRDGQFESGMNYLECEFPGTEFDDGKMIPLIFKKLDGNRAQELLSGEVFVITTLSSNLGCFFDNSDRTLEKFQEDLTKYSKENVLITATAEEYDDRSDVKAIFEVNDEFKSLYSDETLQNKNQIIELLRNAREQGRTIFKQEFQNYMGEVHSIAETDNVLYDYDHVEHSSRKM